MAKPTTEQADIIKHTTGHAKVMAGAGSGKTTVLVKRIVSLIKGGVAPNEILVLMFNASARDQFKDRLVRTLTEEGVVDGVPSVLTFNGLGGIWVKILTKANLIPTYKFMPNKFEYKKVQREFIADAIGKKLYGGVKQPHAYAILDDFFGFVDLCKNELDTDPNEVLKMYGFPERYSYFYTFYVAYERYREQHGFRFFTDMIYDPIIAIRESAEARKLIASHFNLKHVLVDEYQDVNHSGQEQIKICAGGQASVMVVGDVDQSIYEWRGAKPEYMLNKFDEDFPNPTIYPMSLTFRYGHRIALAGSHLVSNIQARPDMTVTAAPTAPNSSLLVSRSSPTNPNIVGLINSWTQQGRALSEACVLLRKFSLSLSIEFSLLKAGIKYRMVGGKSFLGNRMVLSILWSLRLIADKSYKEKEPTSRFKMIHAFLGDLSPIAFGDNLMTLTTAISSADSVSTGFSKLSDYADANPVPSLSFFGNKKKSLWVSLEDLDGSKESPTDALAYVFEKSKIFDQLESLPDAKMKESHQLLEDFLHYVQCLCDENPSLSLADFLDQMEEYATLHERALDIQASEDDEDALLITSVHRSKGLEWPLVIIPHLYEGGFPHLPRTKVEKSIFDIDNERRLFYVAMTRSIEHLVLFTAHDDNLIAWSNEGLVGCPDWLESNTERSSDLASRFLYELNYKVSANLDKVIDGSLTPPGSERTVLDKYIDKASN